jgi:hypothetical protein
MEEEAKQQLSKSFDFDDDQNNCSPEQLKKTKTKLRIGQKDIQKLENEVKMAIRRTKTTLR